MRVVPLPYLIDGMSDREAKDLVVSLAAFAVRGLQEGALTLSAAETLVFNLGIMICTRHRFHDPILDSVISCGMQLEDIELLDEDKRTEAFREMCSRMAATLASMPRSPLPATWLKVKLDSLDAPSAFRLKGREAGTSPDRIELMLAHAGGSKWLERFTGFVESKSQEDEVWYFRSPPETWARQAGRAGFALVRDGLLVRALHTDSS